ncbi:MAG TPA: HD domain-containing protein [Longimicrobium sp.]|jgi:(p)ppGpp synthase/HD superfamily hydrolase|nr:HD domain-containing protein [Longimicrobium sp.]
MADLETAIGIAVEAHRGQKDRAGAPYILHPLRMMFRVQTDAERMAAVLHDVVEDTDWTLDALRERGFPDEVVDAVDHLTRREGESYDEFVTRAAAHPVARRVKLADLEDNMDVRRTGTLSDKDVERLGRYLRAWRRLTHDLPG